MCINLFNCIYYSKNEYVFSKDFIKKVDEIISYDTNFVEAYNNIKSVIVDTTSKDKDTKQDSEDEKSKSEDEQSDSNKQEENEEILIENAIGGANESESENIPQLSQEEQDIIDVKNTTSFIKPIEGSISSPYGYREKATGSVPKNHTGIDIAANKGTKILSATDGKVLVASAEGDYRETFKNSNRGSYCRICTL